MNAQENLLDDYHLRLTQSLLEICCQIINAGPLTRDEIELLGDFDQLQASGIIRQASGKPQGWVEFDPIQFNRLIVQ